MAKYTPEGGSELDFHLLVDPPERETRQTMSERMPPGGSRSIIDYIGKPVTKIRGAARFDSYSSLTTFEGAVGTQGVLVYTEEPSGIAVIFVSLQRSRVTPSDIHIANVEFWILPPTSTIVRQLQMTASYSGPVSGSGSIANVLAVTVSYGFDSRTGECRITTPIKPPCTYDDVITVVMGAGGAGREDGTTAPITRFTGVVRDFQYSDNPPSVQMTAKGYLVRAIEYENHEETFNNPWLGAAGILIGDILGGTGSGALNQGSSAAIVKAVLTKANVPYTASNILGSSVIYGGSADPKFFMWHSGGPGLFTFPTPQEQGETAMSYIERYDTIDAEITGPNAGGRYRTFETLGGTVMRVRVGGRPQSTQDHTLTEEVDILGGQFQRSISQTRNYFVVKGQYFNDMDGTFGNLSFALQSSNPFQPSTSKHTYQMSSDMIERGNNSGDVNQYATGMSCETLANALELEYNREIVNGWVETWRDDAFGIAQTHLVQGPAGTVGALGLAEKVWVQQLDISIDERGFTQRLTYLGGGLPAGAMEDLDLLRAEERRQLVAA